MSAGRWDGRMVYLRAMKNNLTLHSIIREEHENKWVALSKDKSKVLGFDSNLVQLRKKLGAQKVIFMKVPPSDVYLSF